MSHFGRRAAVNLCCRWKQYWDWSVREISSGQQCWQVAQLLPALVLSSGDSVYHLVYERCIAMATRTSCGAELPAAAISPRFKPLVDPVNPSNKVAAQCMPMCLTKYDQILVVVQSRFRGSSDNDLVVPVDVPPVGAASFVKSWQRQKCGAARWAQTTTTLDACYIIEHASGLRCTLCAPPPAPTTAASPPSSPPAATPSATATATPAATPAG